MPSDRPTQAGSAAKTGTDLNTVHVFGMELCGLKVHCKGALSGLIKNTFKTCVWSAQALRTHCEPAFLMATVHPVYIKAIVYLLYSCQVWFSSCIIICLQELKMQFSLQRLGLVILFSACNPHCRMLFCSELRFNSSKYVTRLSSWVWKGLRPLDRSFHLLQWLGKLLCLLFGWLLIVCLMCVPA